MARTVHDEVIVGAAGPSVDVDPERSRTHGPTPEEIRTAVVAGPAHLLGLPA